MIDLFMIFSAIVFAIVFLVLSFFLVAYFRHPDDKHSSWFSYAIAIFGIWLAMTTVMLLPYDIADARGTAGGNGMRIDVLWEIICIVLAVFVAILIPFAYFYYDAADRDEEEKAHCCSADVMVAIRSTIIFAAIFIALCVVLYLFLATALVPVKRLAIPFAATHAAAFEYNASIVGCTDAMNCTSASFDWTIDVSFPIFLLALLSFIGWFVFALFAGAGLIALPMDLINGWRMRPKVVSLKEHGEEMRSIGERAKKLLAIGEKLMGDDYSGLKADKSAQGGCCSSASAVSATRKRNISARFAKAVYHVEKDYDRAVTSFKFKGAQNPLWEFTKLIFGIVSLLLSATWLIHIVIFDVADLHPFLNDFLIKLEAGVPGFPLFGVCAFALYALYLLWCVVKGGFKMGLRIPFLAIFPMEVHGTYLSALLFNIWLILLCTFPCVQFLARSFPIYARYSTIDMFIGTEIKNMKFFQYLFKYDVFVYILLVFSLLALVYLLACPKDREKELEEKLKKIAMLKE